MLNTAIKREFDPLTTNTKKDTEKITLEDQKLPHLKYLYAEEVINNVMYLTVEICKNIEKVYKGLLTSSTDDKYFAMFKEYNHLLVRLAQPYFEAEKINKFFYKDRHGTHIDPIIYYGALKAIAELLNSYDYYAELYPRYIDEDLKEFFNNYNRILKKVIHNIQMNNKLVRGNIEYLKDTFHIFLNSLSPLKFTKSSITLYEQLKPEAIKKLLSSFTEAGLEQEVMKKILMEEFLYCKDYKYARIDLCNILKYFNITDSEKLIIDKINKIIDNKLSLDNNDDNKVKVIKDKQKLVFRDRSLPKYPIELLPEIISNSEVLETQLEAYNIAMEYNDKLITENYISIYQITESLKFVVPNINSNNMREAFGMVRKLDLFFLSTLLCHCKKDKANEIYRYAMFERHELFNNSTDNQKSHFFTAAINHNPDILEDIFREIKELKKCDVYFLVKLLRYCKEENKIQEIYDCAILKEMEFKKLPEEEQKYFFINAESKITSKVFLEKIRRDRKRFGCNLWSESSQSQSSFF